MAKRKWVIAFAPFMALATLLAVPLQLNWLLIMWKIHQAKQNDAIRAALLCDETALLRLRPINACAIAKNSSRQMGWSVHMAKFSSPLTDPGRSLIWTHRKFYKGFRGKGRSRKPNQNHIWKGPQIKVSVWLSPCAASSKLRLVSSLP